MSNFEGVVKKNANSFKPQVRGGSGAGVGKTVAGLWPGDSPVTVFEKADQPVLDTTPTPRTDGRGESEIGLSGQVDHPNNDGQAVYAAAQIAREYRHIVAPVGGIENLSVEQRRQMRDELVRRVGATADGAQQPEGDSASAQATRTYVWEVASLLFGLIDELTETPTFLTRSDSGTLIKSLGTDVTVYCRILHKDASKREVHGVIAEEAVDNSGEIFDYASSEPHFRKWSSDQAERTLSAGLPVSYGNVRAQHSHEAVGKLTSIQFDSANKRIPVVAKIVDDAAWAKVQAGVYSGFSIGGKYLNKWADGKYTRYTAYPAEVSLVDNPCMPGATFQMVKDAPANPELAALKKQLGELTEKIRTIIARRAGVLNTGSSDRGDRFVNKSSGSDPQQLIKQALANGTPVQFSGADPRSAAEKASGSGRKFQPR